MSDDIDDDIDDDLDDEELDFDDDLDIDLDDEPVTSNNVTLTVSEFIGHVNEALEVEFSPGVWIEGEVQRWRVIAGKNGKTNAYCQLNEVENGRVVAVLELSFFNVKLTHVLNTLKKHGLKMEDGVKIRVRGRPEIYDASGKFSLIVSDIDPRFTLGDMQANRDAIIAKLKKAGLYDENRERRLVDLPLRVGLVSSVGTAGWHDVLSKFEASGLPFQLKVANVRVQGNEAVPGIVDAIWKLGTRDDIDAIMLFRGGGSKTDLACFDAEAIAVAIAQCRLPVLTGLGHQIDLSIADEVAYRNFITPTACAEFVIDRVKKLVDRAEGSWDLISRGASASLDLAEARLVERATVVKSNAVQAVGRAHTTLELAAQRVLVRPKTILGSLDQHLVALEARTRLLDPVNTMARGWSITRAPDGTTLRSTKQVREGEALVTTLADGTITSTVTGKDTANG